MRFGLSAIFINKECAHNCSARHWILAYSNVRAISFPEPAILGKEVGTRGSGIIRCRKPGILAKIELRIPFQRPIRFLPETDYPRASRSFPRIAGSGNEIDVRVNRLKF